MQEVILKKVMFGGYDCYEVMNHINAMQIKLNRTKKDSDKLEELRLEAESLKVEIAEKDEEISRLTEELNEREKAQKKNQPSKLFLKKTEEYTDNYVEAARSLEKSVRELTADQILEAKRRISTLQAELENISSAIEETFVSVSDLKNDYRDINASYKEIINEAAAAEKKEKKPAEKKTAKKSTMKTTQKSSPKKTKADNADALELIRQSEEKYNKI